MVSRGTPTVEAIEKQFEDLMRYEEAKLVKYEICQWVWDMLSDETIAGLACGVWVVNAGCDVE